MARKTWRCFFCDEVFTRREDAALHFGEFDREVADEPLCQIKAHETHLGLALRKAHQEIKRLLSDEDDATLRSLMDLEGDVNRRVTSAEETGYGRGVRDMQALALKQFGREVAL